MNITKERFLEIRSMMMEREKRTPAIGSAAPDFELERLSPEGERTGQTEKLSTHRGRPVAYGLPLPAPRSNGLPESSGWRPAGSDTDHGNLLATPERRTAAPVATDLRRRWRLERVRHR